MRLYVPVVRRGALDNGLHKGCVMIEDSNIWRRYYVV